MHSLPPVLSIAGSDNSAGAGIQADLKTMSALEVYGLTAVTCVVAEVPGKVSAIYGVPPALVAEQIRLLFEAFPIAALKTGMLYSTEILRSVIRTLGEVAVRRALPPLVVDPVMVATSGDSLLENEAVAVYCEGLFPASDLLIQLGGEEHLFEAPFVYGVSTHGTGCTYSAAVAAELGKGAGLVEAVGVAKQFVSRAVSRHMRWERSGQQTDALHHFAR
ncbi:MAG: hydroxymethylpyrimidine/phosphomethylpyrimidine kinase [Proteobacteria bacterium]|nr:hydroxymethylpyrimidine/phosphomethylpyrimidine kinase [Pseudomonadota bacterium]